jgi:hypothetical protein
MRPIFVRIFDESAIPCGEKVRGSCRGRGKTKTDREKLKTLLEILFIIGLESGSPCLEFSFEGHFLGSEGLRWLRGEEKKQTV